MLPGNSIPIVWDELRLAHPIILKYQMAIYNEKNRNKKCERIS